MADELDDEERALLDKHRAEKKRAAEEDKEVWVKKGDAEAAAPYSKLRAWFQRELGIDLDEEPVQEPPESKPKPDAKPADGSGAVTRFGRRVG